MKICSKCKKEKPLSEFNHRNNRKCGRVSRCKECTHQSDSNRWNGGQKKKSHRNWHLKNTYGISLDDYNKMFGEQHGCCSICGKHQSILEMALSVDHDHESGAVRRLLCNVCNIHLGQLEAGRLWYLEHKKEVDNYVGDV